MDDFFTKKKCDRCGGDLPIRIMSRFNTDCICMKCAEEERNHPDYEKACEAERAAVLAGNRNFPGIGYPGKKTVRRFDASTVIKNASCGRLK